MVLITKEGDATIDEVQRGEAAVNYDVYAYVTDVSCHLESRRGPDIGNDKCCWPLTGPKTVFKTIVALGSIGDSCSCVSELWRTMRLRLPILKRKTKEKKTEEEQKENKETLL